MKKDDLKAILDKHSAWLRAEKGGERANLSGANLSCANLSGANLSCANLSWADLSWANLSWANLSGSDLIRANLSGSDLTSANLSWANLSGSDLTRANLSCANLTGANLTSANLTGANLTSAEFYGTSLSVGLLAHSRRFARECPPTKRGGRIVYRTANSMHVASTKYAPGHTYTAPHLSWSAETDCHPGIYAASLEWMKLEYPKERLVRCYVRDGDWTITAKGAIRCERLRVLGYVND